MRLTMNTARARRALVVGAVATALAATGLVAREVTIAEATGDRLTPRGVVAEPSSYLPADQELPAGFVHRPELIAANPAPSSAMAARSYLRGLEQILIVGAEENDGEAAAFGDSVAAAERQGWRTEPLAGLGEEAFIARRTLDFGSSGLLVQFRVGAVVGAVTLVSMKPGPSDEQTALAVARLIEARAWAGRPTG
jgi:hypothetical protein